MAARFLAIAAKSKHAAVEVEGTTEPTLPAITDSIVLKDMFIKLALSLKTAHLNREQFEKALDLAYARYSWDSLDATLLAIRVEPDCNKFTVKHYVYAAFGSRNSLVCHISYFMVH